MATLNKRDLLNRILDAIKASGWWAMPVSTAHPLLLRVFRDSESHLARFFIWNLTHGGGRARPSNEFRIQVTGVSAPLLKSGADLTLLLGWHERLRVFAAYDVHHHNTFSSYSPSIQVQFETLEAAARQGIAVQRKGSDEIVVAFAPAFLMQYALDAATYHGTINSRTASQALVRAARGQKTSTAGLSAPRVQAVSTVLRYSRDASFRNRVLAVYSHACTVCGVQLGLVEAAHVVPVGEPGSTDETSNGLALCTLHHRSYDTGLIAILPDYSIRVSSQRVDELKQRNLVAGLSEFSSGLYPKLVLPPDTRDRPSPEYLRIGTSLRGWV